MKKIYLLAILLFTLTINAQVVLSGSSYSQDFDGLASGLPTGWSVFTGATSTALGTSASLTTTATVWNNTAGAYKNCASADGLTSTATSTDQSNSTDRSLALRQTSSYGNPGGAFAVLLANTNSKTDFTMAFKLQSLDATSPRITTWEVQYGIGVSPSTFTTVATLPTPLETGNSSFTNSTVAVDFGSALDNQSGPVWIRIVTLTSSAGSGSRPTSGIDDFGLAWTNAASSTPTITSSTLSVSGLNYSGTGPSGSQSFTLSGSDLTGNITGNAITNFEFSLDNTTFSSFPGSITPFAGNVPPTTVYVRLISGLAVGSYSETLTLSSSGASSVDIDLIGSVLPNVVLNEFLADPDATNGDANGDGIVSTTNDEFIEFYNLESIALDISGWTISDAGAVQHTFPASTTLPAHSFVTVFAGGTPTGISGLVMTAIPSGLSLNNGGDDITLKDALGNIIVTYTYGSEAGNNEAIGRDPDTTGAFVTHSTIGAVTGRLFSPGAFNVTPASACSISAISAGTPSACNPSTITYTVDITVTYSSAPASGTLNINGTSFAITGSPQTETLTLPADGNSVDVTAVFSVDGSCTLTETALFTAPVSCLAPIPSCSELFFSEYVEGSSNNKCLEIYNPTSSAIDLSAGGYNIVLYANGSTSTTTGPIALTGSVPAYGTFVICNSGAGADFLAVADDASGTVTPATFYNGDDVVALRNGTTLIDVIGKIGEDPGSAWTAGAASTANQTLVRNATVLAGDNDGNNTFDPSAQWTSLGLDVFSDLGSFTNDCTPFIWTGNISTDWNLGGNWSKNSVPTATDEIIIPTSPAGALFPTTTTDVTVSDLTIETGAEMNIGSQYGLILDGTVNNSGTLTLLSDVSGTAFFDDFTNTGNTFTGNLTVQRYITSGAGLGQRYFGTAVNNGVVSGLDATYIGYPLGQLIPDGCNPNQLAVGSPYSNLFEWHENATFATSCVQEGWYAISGATALTNARGYSGWMNDASTLEVSGTPNTGAITFAATSITASGVADAQGWHLLANPYPSPMSVDAAYDDGFTSPQYYNASSGAYSGTFQPVLVAGSEVPVMQGFVAQTNGTAFSPDNSYRVSASNANFFKNDDWFTYRLDIEVIVNGMADITYIAYDDEATNAFDNTVDCVKRSSKADRPTLFTWLNGETMSINDFELANFGTSVDMGLLAPENGNYTFSFAGLETFPVNTTIYLEDKLTGIFHNVSSGAYTFSATANEDNTNRFAIHFVKPVEYSLSEPSCEEPTAEFIDLSNDGRAFILTNMNDATSIDGYLDGFATNINSGDYELTAFDAFGGSQNYNFTVQEIVPVNVEIEALNLNIEVGETINFSSITTGADTYNWTINGVVVAQTELLAYTFNDAGVYTIELSGSNLNCAALASMQVEVSEKTTGIRNVNSQLIDLYVANNDAYVSFSNNKSNTAEFMVYDLLGKEVHKRNLNTNQHYVISLKNLSSGYYFIKVKTNNEEKVIKTILK